MEGTGRIRRDADLEELFGLLETRKMVTFLFVDQTDFCQKYAAQAWVADEANIIDIDTEILEHFQIGKVPQYRFFQNGSEVAALVGTVPREDVFKIKKEHFGDFAKR